MPIALLIKVELRVEVEEADSAYWFSKRREHLEHVGWVDLGRLGISISIVSYLVYFICHELSRKGRERERERDV